MEPTLHRRAEDEVLLPVLAWDLGGLRQVVSSAPVGGGVGPRRWVLNASVPMGYDRVDLDAHIATISADLGLVGEGVGMLTGVDVADVVTESDAGCVVSATVGVGAPAWAAAPDGDLRQPGAPGSSASKRWPVGTINLVAWCPHRLSDAALVNAIGTITEAKAQALWDEGVEATGTASDAVCVVCPLDGPSDPFGGPRSIWGARLARASHRAVRLGTARWLANPVSWSAGAAAGPR